MAKIKWVICGILFTLHAWGAVGQVNRYFVRFTDKSNSPFSIDNPSEFLSFRAIERREKLGILITEEDLPVDTAYVNRLKKEEADVFFTSKWQNGALVQMDFSRLTVIQELPFVSEVVYLAPGGRLSRTPVEVEIADTFVAPPQIQSTTETQLSMLGADRMHVEGYRGEGMLIAVFDDGFAGVNQVKPFEHLFSENRIPAWKDFVGNTGNPFLYDDHGTRVLSCLAADLNEEVRGTAYKASYLLLVTEDYYTEYRIEEYNWLLAAEFADSAGADVINGSLGYSDFDDPSMDYSYEDLDGQTALVTRAAETAASKGMIVVVSAGNSGSSSWKYVTPPADAPQVLAVGNVNSSLMKASSSSVGPTSDERIKPDVAALGVGVAVVQSSGAVTGGNGTSFASPLVAGFAACVWQAHPEWTNLQVMAAIKNSGHRAYDPDTLVGYGVPDYLKTSTYDPLYIKEVLAGTLQVFPNPFSGNKVLLDLTGINLELPYEIQVVDLRGRRIYQREFDPESSHGQIEIGLGEITSATYFLTISSRKFSKTIKLVKI